MTDLTSSPLGHQARYSDRYDPQLLFPVERAPLRAALGITGVLPFHGEDVWTAYELSWLDPQGKPMVAIATFRVPAATPRIVESKSMKLYLTAFNQTAFVSAAQVQETLARDLASATGGRVQVELTLPERFGELPHDEPQGICLDDLPLVIDTYAPEPGALVVGEDTVEERLYSRLFRSLCPVTGQPDYASIGIAYRGRRIDHAGVLRYLVSFRQHPGFHEDCVERIFVDLTRRCAPETLCVHARFTRRGGIDINPYRSSVPLASPANTRTARQ